MNSVANGKIRTHTPFEEIYVQPGSLAKPGDRLVLIE